MEELTLQIEEEQKLPAMIGAGSATSSADGGVIQMFRRAARLTAQTLLLETEGTTAANPGFQTEMEQEQGMAQQELSEGDAKALADDDEAAIQNYRQAWLHASSAKLHAIHP